MGGLVARCIFALSLLFITGRCSSTSLALAGRLHAGTPALQVLRTEHALWHDAVKAVRPITVFMHAERRPGCAAAL